jgi:hypothetical protein
MNTKEYIQRNAYTYHFVSDIDSFQSVYGEDGVLGNVHESAVGVEGRVVQGRAVLHLVAFLSAASASVCIAAVVTVAC